MSGESLVELAVRLLEPLLGDPLGRDAVIALDLVPVGDLLAGQLARRRFECSQLGRDPRAVRALADSRRVLGQPRWIAGILGFHLLGDLRRAVVRVDEVLEVLPEAEREPEIFLGGPAHERSKRAACPCPTPTQSVARP